MSSLNIHLLGTPQIELDGSPVSIRRSKGLALLVYLAMRGEPQRRDTLATLLWPESNQQAARSSLRRELSHLNKALVGEWLVVEGETIGLHPATQVDVVQFQQHLTAFDRENPIGLEALHQAVILYRDDFLSGFTLPDCPDFDEWQFFQTESLRQALATALEDLVLGLSLQGDYEGAIPPARRWLALDPLHEQVHQALMRLYAFSGRQSAALRQFDECQRILEEELGVEPEAETQALAAAIRAKRLVPPVNKTSSRPDLAQAAPNPTSTAHEAPPQETVAPRPVFVGREAQLNHLAQALSQALDGHGQLRLISGEAGAGKSALITEFLYGVQRTQPNLIVTIGTTDAQTGQVDPFLPFREALLRLVRGSAPHQTTVRLVLLEQGPDVAGSFIPASELPEIVAQAQAIGWQGQFPLEKQTAVQQQPIEQSKLIEQYVAVLHALAAQTPLILILEDLHWADSASLGLFFRLGRQVADSCLLILGTYRVEQTPPRSQGKDSGQGLPLSQIAHELQRHLGEIRIDLEVVRQTEGRTLVDGLLDTEPNQLNESFRQALYRQTGGHPLFVVELLQELKRSAALVRLADGRWTVGANLDWQTLPARVEGAIAGRIARLSQEEQWWLTIASVSGESFYGEVIAQVAGVDPRELGQTLSRILQSQHRLVEAEGVERFGQQRLTRYRFRHNLIQVYLYEQLDVTQRVYLHEDVAQALETLYGKEVEQIAVQLARHYHMAGIAEKAVDYLILAAQQAAQLAAYDEAVARLRQADTLLSKLPESPKRREQAFTIEFGLGQNLGATNGIGTPESGAAYTHALALARQLGESSKIVRVLYSLTFHAVMRAELDEAQRYGEMCLGVATEMQDHELQVMANRTLRLVAYWLGEYAKVVEYDEWVIAFYRGRQSALTHEETYGLADTLAAMGLNLYPLGYPDRALTEAQAGLALVQAQSHQLGIVSCSIYLATIHLYRGEWRSAMPYTEDAVRLAQHHGFQQMALWAEVLQGEILIWQGEPTAGIQLVRQAIAGREAIGSYFANGSHLARVAQACSHMGHVAEGLALIEEGMAQATKIKDRTFDAKIQQIRGDLLLMQTLPPPLRAESQIEAEACFRRAVTIAQSRSAKLWEARALASLCRLLHSQGRDKGCRQQLIDLYAWFTEGFAVKDMRVIRAIIDETA